MKILAKGTPPYPYTLSDPCPVCGAGVAEFELSYGYAKTSYSPACLFTFRPCCCTVTDIEATPWIQCRFSTKQEYNREVVLRELRDGGN